VNLRPCFSHLLQSITPPPVAKSKQQPQQNLNTATSSSTTLSQRGFTLINIKKNVKTEPNDEEHRNKKIKSEPSQSQTTNTVSSSTTTSPSDISSSPPIPPAPPASPIFDSNSQKDSSKISALPSPSSKDSSFFFSIPTHASSRFDKEDIRKMWPAEHHCDDGHYVRSMGELLIDNWLYHHKYVSHFE